MSLINENILNNLENVKEIGKKEFYSMEMFKIKMLGLVIVSIILYGCSIIHYYQHNKTADNRQTIDFVHKVAWGSDGTDGVLLVAAKLTATLLTILIGLSVFKRAITHGETILKKYKYR
jgi:hypothetical protein